LPDITDAIEFQMELDWRKQGNVCSGF
jgi:hypothetical protein